MPTSPRESLRSIFDAAVAAAHPQACLPAHLPPAPEQGRIIILGAGKAAASMSEVALAHYRAQGIDDARITGLAVTRHGYGGAAGPIRIVEAGHPVPDEAGIAATRETLALAGSAMAEDLVLVLLSGGGSANWIAPAEGIDLAEKQAITRALLRSGAPIDAINTVRKRLSQIKGGRLARAASPARIVTLAISDVPRDDPAVIASGPSVPDPTTHAEARALIERYGVALSDAAQALMRDDAPETPKPGDPVFAESRFSIIARPQDAMDAACAQARREGYEPVMLGADLEGEARAVAAAHAGDVREIRRAGKRAALISGGELTVTITGEGRGGPNQEYALALALALDGLPRVAALSGDTDGTDGGIGAADDPAGAIIDDTTLSRAHAKGVDAQRYLSENDSTGFFTALDDLLIPGPTRTNVNDCRIILID
ncbi:MAG: glycerate kinase [Salinarimonas sp.]|nr:glycerate kinase [Salinarimonas sp.]